MKTKIMPTKLKNKLTTTSIKLYPKLLVIMVGLVVFLVADSYLVGNIQSLAINISAALISIPIIFIVYEIWHEKSQKKLNESVYSYAQNEMSVALQEIKEQMRFFIDGAFVYFEDGDIVVHDDIEKLKLKLKMNENAKILYTEDGEAYQKKYQLENFEDTEETDIYSFEKDTIVEVIHDARYLSYQLIDLEVHTNLQKLESLLNNSFIMERLDDEKTQIIVHLVEAMKMLESFLQNHDDLFLRTSIRIEGFDIKVEDENIYNLFYVEKDKKTTSYEQQLDSKLLMDSFDKKDLLNVYIVNPDYYIIFGDLVQEVLSCVKDWIDSGDGVFVDYSTARIGVM
jgi:hypothetical protein